MDVAPSWQSDPSGRHELRYWDGSAWTAAVADGGVQAEDPPGWPSPPGEAGLGLRSGYLRYFRFGSGPWPIVDRAGTQVGQVARQSLGFGGRTSGVWDMQDALWLLVKQSLKGTLLLAGDTEVGRVGWHGVGAMSTVNISMQLGGRPRARMLAKGRNLRDGTARVVDPAGTDLLSVQLEEERRGRVFTLTRLVGTPDDYEYLVQGLIPALILELDSRTAFETTGDDPNTW